MLVENSVKDKGSCFGLLAQFDEGSIVPTIGAAVNAYVATHRVKWGTENIGGRARRGAKLFERAMYFICRCKRPTGGSPCTNLFIPERSTSNAAGRRLSRG